MTLSGLDIIARGDDFEDRAASYEFRAWQWALLHAVDGKTELRDIAMTGGLDIEAALDFVHEGQAAGLVHVVSMTLDEYRRSAGIASPYAAVSAPSPTMTHGDHFSATDNLGSYEHSVPAWMIEHDAPSTAPAPDVHEEPTAEKHDEPVAAEPAPSYSWYAPSLTPEPVPEHHDDEAVAEHHDDEAVAEHHDDEAVAEHHDDEAVAEHHDDHAVAEHHEEPVAEHHEAPVAEHHEEAASEAYVAPSTTHAWSFASAVDERHDSVAADEHDSRATQPTEPADSFALASNAHSVSMPSSNGHSNAPSWEPMSLVTSVDEPSSQSAHAAHDEPLHDAQHEASNAVPDGVSIWLSSNSEAPAEYEDLFPEPAAEEKGSINFSFAPEVATHEETAPAAHAETHAVAEAPSEHPEHDAMHDVPDVHEIASVPEVHGATADVHALVAASPEPAVESQQEMAPAMSAAQAQPAPAASSTTADIVGNLISRALTFRIK